LRTIGENVRRYVGERRCDPIPIELDAVAACRDADREHLGRWIASNPREHRVEVVRTLVVHRALLTEAFVNGVLRAGMKVTRAVRNEHPTRVAEQACRVSALEHPDWVEDRPHTCLERLRVEAIEVRRGDGDDDAVTRSGFPTRAAALEHDHE